MTFLRLFLRDIAHYHRQFTALTAAACLICAILTGALLIGDSVRGTLQENAQHNANFAQYRLLFSKPVTQAIHGSVLHAKGFIAPGIPVHIYAFHDNTSISSRDAFASPALAGKLNLKDGDLLPVRLQTLSLIPNESPMGRPPKLKQVPFIWRGIWNDPRNTVNFHDPQLPPYSLFVNLETLSDAIGMDKPSVNEAWTMKPPSLHDQVVWELSGLYFDSWDKQPVLKSRSFFLPEQIAAALPEATRGLILFAETFTDRQHTLSYCFTGAFDGSFFPVPKDQVILSSELMTRFNAPASLTFFTTESFRQITRRTLSFSSVSYKSDSVITSALTPEIPGLTNADSCSEWEAGLPVDFDKVSKADEDYWTRHRSKPKLYLNFQQAQSLFAPGKCSVLIFPPDADIHSIQAKLMPVLRNMQGLYKIEDTVQGQLQKIDNGVQFAPLFLGLSFFIIISALLMLAMLLKLHLQDRAQEISILFDYIHNKLIRRFFMLELLSVLIPGMVLGLPIGIFICKFQLLLLEQAWNGIVLMGKINFHATNTSFPLAFGISLACAMAVLFFSLRHSPEAGSFLIPKSHFPKSATMLGFLSFLRNFRQYLLCYILLVLGFLGTLGVGSFGIKSRGEDAFGFRFIAQTLLPVIPSFQNPFPDGAIPVRVYSADRADCSNLLQAPTPTVYGCDLKKLTGNGDFLDQMSAAVDSGSLKWIIKKKQHDIVSYPNGSLSLDKIMKASVFQGGILTDLHSFEQLFPETEGAEFFLIKDEKSAEIWREYLEPYGLKLLSTDEFMQEAERFQNRYLAIFLQLGILGFILGLGALILLIKRNLNAKKHQLTFLSETGWPQSMIYKFCLSENLFLFLTSAFFSLLLLVILAFTASLSWPALLIGWAILTTAGTSLITVFCLQNL